MHVSSTSTPARRGLARSSPVTVTSRFGRGSGACGVAGRDTPVDCGASGQGGGGETPSRRGAPSDEAGLADAVCNGKGHGGRSRIAPRLRPPTDDAGLADLVWNGKG